MGYEDRIDIALEPREKACAEILENVSRGKGQGLAHGGPTLTGQMKYVYLIMMFVRNKPKMTVNTHAPMKPSTVFFGEILIS